MNLFLAGYGAAGRGVLAHLLRRSDIDRLAVFTHPDSQYACGLEGDAKASGLWSTCSSINRDNWPFQPDAIASVYYRTIISQAIISKVKGRIFNAHAALLPRHRGRSPIPWAIIDGDKLSGVTFHYIDAGIDTGDIIFQVTVQIAEDDTQASLFEKVNKAVVDYWPAAFELVKLGIPGQPQHGDASYHTKGCPHDGRISPNWPRDYVERFIRAMIYPPYPPATYNGQQVLCWSDYKRLRHNERHYHYAI